MGMFNDLFELLADVPPMLATAWFVWLSAGGLLIMWSRRSKVEAAFPAPATRPAPARPKPVARPSSSADMHATETPATDTAAARAKPPLVVGDPYGDLATLLDQPTPTPAAALPPPVAPEPRAPAESPILSSAGSPIRRANNTDSNYAAS
jgi:hypothetical protein